MLVVNIPNRSDTTSNAGVNILIIKLPRGASTLLYKLLNIFDSVFPIPVAISDKMIIDSPDSFILKSHHAGMTEAEMRIPIILVDCK